MKAVTAFFVLALCLPAACFAADENVTITTYYPSPHGVYRNLQLFPSPQPDCDAASEGLIYYNGTASERGLRLCLFNGSGYEWSADFGGGDSGSWQQNATTHVVNNTNSGNVSIGTDDAEATLTTYREDNAGLGTPEVPLVGAFTKHLPGQAVDQWLSFAGFPSGTGYAPYLDRTSLIYASTGSPSIGAAAGNLKLAAANSTSSIIFLVGSNFNPSTETMHMTNLCYDGTNACPHVGIMSPSPVFPLQVESDVVTGPIMVRAATAGVKSGTFNICPSLDHVHLAFGCYLWNGTFYNDPYVYGGVANHYGSKLTINQQLGAQWTSYDNVNGNAAVGAWNRAFEKILWDLNGTLQSDVKLPSGSTAAAMCNGTNRGAMIYNTSAGTTNFFGCTSSGWKKLNN